MLETIIRWALRAMVVALGLYPVVRGDRVFGVIGVIVASTVVWSLFLKDEILAKQGGE